MRKWMAGVLSLGFVGSTACLHCGTSGSPLVSSDAQAPREAGEGRDATPIAPSDGGVGDAPPQYDSGKIGACPMDPGWHVVPTEGPACTVLAPDDVHASIPNPKWIPCTNGRAGCQELERLGPPIPRYNPFRASMLGRALGKKQLILEWERETNAKYGPCLRSVILDLANIESPDLVAAWDGTSVAPDGLCLGQLVPSTGRTGLIFYRNASTSLSMGSDLSMQKIVAMPHVEDGNDARASESVLATRNSAAGLVFRMPFGSNQAVTVRTPQGVSALLMDMVEGGDVFARSNYGTTGWMQWYRADADGQARLVLSRPSAHVFHLRSDGTSLFWIEGSGNPGSFWPQPTMEVWSAPYSSDLDAVRAGAHKLADVSGSFDFVENAVASNGFYAFADVVDTIVVVRGSDGAKQVVNVGPIRKVFNPLYVTSTEVWFQYFVAPSTSGVARIQLGPWP